MNIFSEVAAAEAFKNQVVAVTGWDFEAARRLDRRLNRLAMGSRFMSHHAYRAEWRRRFLAGWPNRAQRIGLIA